MGGRTLCKGLRDKYYAKVGESTLYKGGTDTITGRDRHYNGASVSSHVCEFIVMLPDMFSL